MADISVILCTHNPRENYLRRTLEALRAQTLVIKQWELLILDNASNPAIETLIDITWHQNARILVESELGKNAALSRGILHSAGALVIIVDDDNVLDPDYLTNALQIYKDYPFLGAFGGSIEAESEVDPPLSILPYREGLAIRRIEGDHWSNAREWSEATPFGAGMCVRREVAELYLDRVRKDRIRFALGPKGTSLGRGEDTDMAWTSFSLNKGTGCFARLRLTHLISKDRLTESYVERLYTGLAYADEILAHEDTDSSKNSNGTVWNTLRYWSNYIRASRFGRKIMKARRSGQKTAREALVMMEPCASLNSQNIQLTKFAPEGAKLALKKQ
jgi:glycosyltransferase involved in cell wall biosynthesis